MKSDNQELKSDKYKLEDNLELAKRKVCKVILKGSFIEYIENTSDHVIVQIKNCCSAFLDGRCLWKRKERRGTEILVDLVRKDMKKIIDYDVSRNEKTKMLSNQQEGPEFSHCYLELFYQLLYLNLLNEINKSYFCKLSCKVL